MNLQDKQIHVLRLFPLFTDISMIIQLLDFGKNMCKIIHFQPKFSFCFKIAMPWAWDASIHWI